MPADRALRLVVGAAQLGQRYGRSGKAAPSDEEVAAILALAARLGCAGVDTARAYGDSEAAIGRARRADAGRSAGAGLPIVTKIRPLSAEDEGRGIEVAVAESLRESLLRLEVRRADAVLLHRATDLARGGGAAIRALRVAQEAGLIGRWGVSVSAPDELLAALAVPGLGYVQLPFNLLDRRWLAPGVQAALASRPEVTIATRSAFLQGILLHPDAALWPAGTEPDASVVGAALVEAAARTGRTHAGLCLGYVLAQPWIHAVVVGVRSAQQLAEVARECETPLTAAECAALENAIPPGSPALVNPALWPQRTPQPQS